jgi:uncharacterized protein with von Willebrand factor type A (vWA) domain
VTPPADRAAQRAPAVAGAALLPAVDRAAFATALADRLRDHGVTVGLTPVQDLVRALGCAPPRTRTGLYWTARVCLIRNHGDLAAFDAVFEAVFGDARLPTDPHARRTGVDPSGDRSTEQTPPPQRKPQLEQEGGGLPWVTRPQVVAARSEAPEPADRSVPQRLPTALAHLADVPFGDLDAARTAELGQWLETVLRGWPTRRTRRFAPQASGARIALRATLARARRTGWEPVHLVRMSPVHRPRRVVMLCDVSRSMQAQAVAYLHLMRALALRADAEVFAFATSLTRLTPVLAQRSAEAAVREASAKVADRFGGTRIAASLRTLLCSHHGGLVRGAVVIIGSDGWDGDPPEELAEQMAKLRRRAYRVVWLNPRAAAPGFTPSTGTMTAALPHCDALVPADSFAALLRVPDLLGTPRR